MDEFIPSDRHDRYFLACIETKKALDLGSAIESQHDGRTLGLSCDPSYRIQYNEFNDILSPKPKAELAELVLWKFLAEHAGKELVLYGSEYLANTHDLDEERWEIIGWDRYWDPTYEEYLNRFIDRPDRASLPMHSGHMLTLEGKEIRLEHPIADAFEIDGKVIVLYDSDSYTKKWGQFPNLIALDPDGKQLWTAELPTTQSQECYYQVKRTNPLIACTWTSWECEIDIETGRVLSRTFLK